MRSNRQRAEAASLAGVFMGKQLSAAIAHESDIVARLTSALGKTEDEALRLKLSQQLSDHKKILAERIADLEAAKVAAHQ